MIRMASLVILIKRLLCLSLVSLMTFTGANCLVDMVEAQRMGYRIERGVRILQSPGSLCNVIEKWNDTDRDGQIDYWSVTGNPADGVSASYELRTAKDGCVNLEVTFVKEDAVVRCYMTSLDGSSWSSRGVTVSIGGKNYAFKDLNMDGDIDGYELRP